MEAKVRFATCIWHDGARDWWCEVVESLEPGVLDSMTWDDFFARFKRDFVSAIEIELLEWE